MDRILEIIADIRVRLGTCQQRDADAAVLLGILDSYTEQLQTANERAERAEENYKNACVKRSDDIERYLELQDEYLVLQAQEAALREALGLVTQCEGIPCFEEWDLIYKTSKQALSAPLKVVA